MRHRLDDSTGTAAERNGTQIPRRGRWLYLFSVGFFDLLQLLVEPGVTLDFSEQHSDMVWLLYPALSGAGVGGGGVARKCSCWDSQSS